jgi:copper resistance protein C
MTPRAGTERLLALLWLSAVWLLLACVPALAHANLIGSSPPAESELSTPPEQVRLRFNEPVDAEFSPLEVRDADGERVDEGDARIDPEDARVVLADLEELPEGSYDVEWRVTSIDGHVVEGRYGFAVTAAGEDRPPSDARGAEGRGEGGGAGQAQREPAQDGEPDGSAPILAYSALSLGALAVVVVAAVLLTRLARRPKA